MPVKTTGTLTTWGLVVVSCVLGCATGTQSDGLLTDPIDQGGSGGSAGSGDSTAGVGAADGTSGSFGTGGAGGSSVAGSGTSGTFAASGTFNAAAGTFGMAGGGATSGGAGGAAGAGGKGGAGGTGGAAAGASGSGGAAGTGGKAGNNPCESTKLTITSATGTQENAGLSPNLAIDGDMVTRWASEKSEPQTLDLDLGEVVTVNRVVINWEAAYATNYQLQIATNAAGPFTTIYSNAAGDGGTDDVKSPALTQRDGRYVRMNGITRKTIYGFSIYEIAVYGDKDETCQ